MISPSSFFFVSGGYPRHQQYPLLWNYVSFPPALMNVRFCGVTEVVFGRDVLFMTQSGTSFQPVRFLETPVGPLCNSLSKASPSVLAPPSGPLFLCRPPFSPRDKPCSNAPPPGSRSAASCGHLPLS